MTEADLRPGSVHRKHIFGKRFPSEGSGEDPSYAPDAPPGGLTGTGIIGRLARWIGAGALGFSRMREEVSGDPGHITIPQQVGDDRPTVYIGGDHAPDGDGGETDQDALLAESYTGAGAVGRSHTGNGIEGQNVGASGHGGFFENSNGSNTDAALEASGLLALKTNGTRRVKIRNITGPIESFTLGDELLAITDVPVGGMSIELDPAVIGRGGFVEICDESGWSGTRSISYFATSGSIAGITTTITMGASTAGNPARVMFYSNGTNLYPRGNS